MGPHALSAGAGITQRCRQRGTAHAGAPLRSAADGAGADSARPRIAASSLAFDAPLTKMARAGVSGLTAAAAGDAVGGVGATAGTPEVGGVTCALARSEPALPRRAFTAVSYTPLRAHETSTQIS